MILLCIVSSYSNPSTYDNLGTFLVCLTIVLSLRKAPIGLVYKPAYAFLCPLASSMHQLPSNLVSPLELSPDSSLRDYPMTARLILKRVAALPRQLLNWSLIRDSLYSQLPL